MGTPVKIALPDQHGNTEERVVGHVSDDGEKFVKRVNDDHFCRKYHGWGINWQVFKNRIKDEVKEIRIIEERPDGGENLFIANINTWLKHGTKDQLGDFPEQIFLAKGDFDKRHIP